eukprot:6181342-Pleurochrysis_carterae.AAC.1
MSRAFIPATSKLCLRRRIRERTRHADHSSDRACLASACAEVQAQPAAPAAAELPTETAAGPPTETLTGTPATTSTATTPATTAAATTATTTATTAAATPSLKTKVHLKSVRVDVKHSRSGLERKRLAPCACCTCAHPALRVRGACGFEIVLEYTSSAQKLELLISLGYAC